MNGLQEKIERAETALAGLWQNWSAKQREFLADDGIVDADERDQLDRIKGKLDQIEAAIQRYRDEFAREAREAGPGGVISELGDLAESVADATAGMARDAARGLFDVVDDAADLALDAAGQVAGEFRRRVDQVAQVAVQQVREAREAINGLAGQAAEWTSGTAQQAMQIARQTAEYEQEAAERAAALAAQATGEAARQAADTAREAAGRAEQAATEATRLLGRAANYVAESAADSTSGAVDTARDAVRRLAELVEAGPGATSELSIEDILEAGRRAREEAERRLAEFEAWVEHRNQVAVEAWQAGAEEIATAAQDAANAASEAANRAAEFVGGVVQDLTGEPETDSAAEQALLAQFEAAGLSEAERVSLIGRIHDDPSLAGRARLALAAMDTAGVPPANRMEMFELSEQNPQSYAAAMEVLADMDSGGPLDVSDSAVADTFQALDEADRAILEPYAELEALRQDPDASPEALEAARNQVGELMVVAFEAQELLRRLREKREFINSLSFGILSASTPEPMADSEVLGFVEAYGRDPQFGAAAVELAENAEDPGLIARNVGMMSERLEGGFADSTGTELAEDDYDRRTMAVNAMRSGARMGQEYFDGFATYMDSGAQHQPDHYYGADQAEAARLRSDGLARWALSADGSVDFSTPDVQAEMDHLMFHPGSLTNYTPALTDQMLSVRNTFTDPATAGDAQNVMRGITEPTDSRARGLVAGTVGEDDPSRISEEDTRAAVLSAMMAPLAQGDAGSCFATAAVRRVRQTDPVAALRSYAEIATTGQLTVPGLAVPIVANQNIPEGENPLMRSWEYTVASASADIASSCERGRLDGGLWDRDGGDRGLGDIEQIVGSEAWNGSNERDPDTGFIDSGIRGRIETAIEQQLRFSYNAELTRPTPTSGDGQSSAGQFELSFNNVAITSEDEFKAAIRQIALGASGESARSENGRAIVELVESREFMASIRDAYPAGGDVSPWELQGGGWGARSIEALNGVEPDKTELMGADDSSASEGDRTRSLLDALVTNFGGSSEEMVMLETLGENANHDFNLLPNHPDFVAISGDDSAEQIRQRLVEPGERIARSAIPAARASAMFEQQIMSLAQQTVNAEDDEANESLMQALEQSPTEDMTPAELNRRIRDATRTYRARVRERQGTVADEWRDGREAAGENVSRRDYRAKLIELREEAERAFANSVDTLLVNALDPPEIVIADANWGGLASQILFVIAPDPSSGELRLWKKDEYSGRLTPADENWIDASWSAVQ